LQLLGALGVFLFGMKYMSEGLQRVAGSRLRSLLGTVTANRLAGVSSGFALTVLVQSSSASTVMIVSFVTAGLLTLTQSIGMIMGANIGTTLTAWMVSLLGFKVNISAFALPAVGVGLGLTFMRGTRQRDWGEVLIGFGLLFLGLQLLRQVIPPIEDAEQMAWIAGLTEYGFLSILIFVVFGAVLTVILQSSSAATTLTLTLAAMGWLPFPMAAAMILGENIGTTITANLAAITGTTDAKRAARVHLIFNLVGVSWALLIFQAVMLPIVNAIVPGNPYIDFTLLQDDPLGQAIAAGIVTTHLAALHTVFNITNTVAMLPFVNHLANLVTRLVPDGSKKKQALRFLHSGLIETPELLIVQARLEMQHMADVVRSMFDVAMHILTEPVEKMEKLVDETLEDEEIVDQLEREISTLLTSTARAATSSITGARVAEMVQNTHRLERIGDHCASLVRIARRIFQSGERFREEDVAELAALGGLVSQALKNLGEYLAGKATFSEGQEIELQIDTMRRSLRARHVRHLQESRDSVEPELAFLDIITHLEEIGDRAFGVIRFAEETKRGLQNV
jgi:phosphate:Na+ symporter